VSYLDVGLTVDVEPQVYLEGDVGIKVSLEVSNIVQQIKSATGTLTYQLGSRNASTNLRLKDGETQVLAGLIADEDRTSANKVPGFGDLPLLGRLFGNQRDELNKTEIVLMITPRIVRSIERPELADGEFFGGTESAASDQALQLRPLPPGGLPAAGVPPAGLPAVPSRPGVMRRGVPAEQAPTEPEELPAEPDPDLPEEPAGNATTQ
jgi:general secretion pathway protein D